MLEPQAKKAYIKGEHLPGDVCEFDWGEVKLEIAGERQTFQMAVFTSAYENYRFAWLFNTQKSECFQEAHAKSFDQIGGVYQMGVRQHESCCKTICRHRKEPTRALLQLSIYYGFQYRFCNIHSGNEKGHVERRMEVIRRKSFASVYQFESMEHAIEHSFTTCNRLNDKMQKGHENYSAHECLQEEKFRLLKLPPTYDAARLENPRVDKNHYSVPDWLVEKKVMEKVYSQTVLCFLEEQEVAEPPLKGDT